MEDVEMNLDKFKQAQGLIIDYKRISQHYNFPFFHIFPKNIKFSLLNLPTIIYQTEIVEIHISNWQLSRKNI